MTSEQRRVLVWDLPLRLFHWLLVCSFCGSWLSAELDEMTWHIRLGLVMLALLVFRLIWGFAGGEAARFARFAASPRQAFVHLRDIFTRAPDREPGHNPAGGLMVFAMLGFLIFQVASGLCANDDIAVEGPLSHFLPHRAVRLISAAHVVNFNILLGLVTLHLAAIAVYRFAKGQNLLRPMLDGHKILPAEIAPPRSGSALIAVFAALAGAGLAFLLASLGE
jgi:cytochrome b